MPKMKSKRGASKRFKATASGFKRGQGFRSHILTKKSTKRKRQLRSPLNVHESNEAAVKQMLPYA